MQEDFDMWNIVQPFDNIQAVGNFFIPRNIKKTV